MRRILWIAGLAVGVTILLVLLHFINQQRMGDLNDLAYDPGRERLFVVAGTRGVYTFQASDGQLKRSSRFSDGGDYRSIAIQGDRAYIADDERGLLVLDISEDRPRLVYAGTDMRGRGLHLSGGLLYLAAGADGLIIFALSDPDAPMQLGRYSDLEDARDVTVEGILAYVADEARGLEILDVSSPVNPARAAFITWDPVYAQAERVSSEAGFVYVAAGERGLQIVDARNHTFPVIAASYLPGAGSVISGVDVNDWNLVLTIENDQDSNMNGLHILDVHNPYTPQLLSVESYAETSEGIMFHGSSVYIANPRTGVRMYDVSNRSDPDLADRFRYFP